MREIDEGAIRRHSDQRFRSEYDYALFEYHRSAKVIAFLERNGVTLALGESEVTLKYPVRSAPKPAR